MFSLTQVFAKSLKKDYDTPDSQDVSVPSTKEAQRCLTCQIGRDGVLSTRYGRNQWVVNFLIFKTNFAEAKWAWLFDVRCSREWFKGKLKLG